MRVQMQFMTASPYVSTSAKLKVAQLWQLTSWTEKIWRLEITCHIVNSDSFSTRVDPIFLYQSHANWDVIQRKSSTRLKLVYRRVVVFVYSKSYATLHHNFINCLPVSGCDLKRLYTSSKAAVVPTRNWKLCTLASNISNAVHVEAATILLTKSLTCRRIDRSVSSLTDGQLGQKATNKSKLNKACLIKWIQRYKSQKEINQPMGPLSFIIDVR